MSNNVENLDIKQSEPDWKSVAYELAYILDDIELKFKMDVETIRRDGAFCGERADEVFLIKKFMAAQKYFRRYKNEILFIDDYERRKEDDKLKTDFLYQSFKKNV